MGRWEGVGGRALVKDSATGSKFSMFESICMALASHSILNRSSYLFIAVKNSQPSYRKQSPYNKVVFIFLLFTIMNEEEQLRVNRYLQQHVSPIGKRIYSMIKDAPQTKTDLRKRTGLPAKQLDDELSTLASYNIIKKLKKPEKKNLNLWVLFHEKEEEEQEEEKNKNQDLIALILKKSASLVSIKKEAVRKNYSVEKLDGILQMLEMRGEIIVKEGEVEIRQMNKIQLPCMKCELRRLCSPGSTISPENCPYIAQW